MGSSTWCDTRRRSGAAAVATLCCSGGRIPRPLPDRRPRPARHPSRGYGAEDRPWPSRNSTAKPDPPNHRKRASAARQAGSAVTRPVITGAERMGHRTELTDGAMPSPAADRLQRSIRRCNHRRLVACEFSRQVRMLGGAVGGEFFDGGSRSDQMRMAGAGSHVRPMAGRADDRPWRCTNLASERVGFGCHSQCPRSRAGRNDHRCR